MTSTTSTTNAPSRSSDAAVRAESIPPADVGLLLVRVVVGVVLVGYGAQKLFGTFGGLGIAGTGDFFESVGFSPGEPLAVLSGLAEIGGGLGLIFGIATPLAGAAVMAVTIGAFDVIRSGADQPFYPTMGGAGWEFMLALAAGAVVLIGPGRYAVDHVVRVGRFLAAPQWRWLGFVAGLLGGVAGVVYRML